MYPTLGLCVICFRFYWACFTTVAAVGRNKRSERWIAPFKMRCNEDWEVFFIIIPIYIYVCISGWKGKLSLRRKITIVSAASTITVRVLVSFSVLRVFLYLSSFRTAIFLVFTTHIATLLIGRWEETWEKSGWPTICSRSGPPTTSINPFLRWFIIVVVGRWKMQFNSSLAFIFLPIYETPLCFLLNTTMTTTMSNLNWQWPWKSMACSQICYIVYIP